jgi:hypothetical protein
MPDDSDPATELLRWTDAHFAPGSLQRGKFEGLCTAGCDARALLSFLSVAALEAETQRTIYDVFMVSRSTLVKLPALLDKAAGELDAVNPILGAYFGAKFVNNPNLSDQIRSSSQQQANVYRRIPELLRVLAIDIQNASVWINDNAGPRRSDSLRRAVVELLEYVDVSTGSPHYEHVSELLGHFVSVRSATFLKVTSDSKLQPGGARKRKKASLPQFINSSDALKALYGRASRYGYRKTKPASKPR